MRNTNRANDLRSGPVRVRKRGNSRNLEIPAEVVRVADIELGDLYMVESVDGDLVFSPVRPGREQSRFVGEDTHCVPEFHRGAGMPVGADPVQPDQIDWDF